MFIEYHRIDFYLYRVVGCASKDFCRSVKHNTPITKLLVYLTITIIHEVFFIFLIHEFNYM